MGQRRIETLRKTRNCYLCKTKEAKMTDPLGGFARGRVLVTGASGFVGSSVARIARAQGFDVRVVVRKTSSRQNLEGLDAEVVIGDMRDEASMRAAMKGVRYVLHVAADYRIWARD